MRPTLDAHAPPLLDDERFLERIGAELSFARRHRTFVALLLLDGIAAAAPVLPGNRGARLAACFAQMIRTEDVAAALPSGPLAILTRGTSPPAMRQMAERLCALGAKQRSGAANERLLHVFIGLALFPVEAADQDDAAALLARAEGALARARTTGKSCVKV